MRAATVLVALLPATAVAQTQSSPPSPQGPPGTTTPQTAPPASSHPTSPTIPAERKAATPAATDDLVGLVAKSADGTNLAKFKASSCCRAARPPSGLRSAVS